MYSRVYRLIESSTAPEPSDPPATGGGVTRGEFAPADAVLTSRCSVCHSVGSTADQAGARLVLGATASARQADLEAFLAIAGDDFFLSKAVGDENHGGGPVLAIDSADYNALLQYLMPSLGGPNPDTVAGSFWDGTGLEDREVTLRRAGLLLAGLVPSDTALSRAQASDDALRAEILGLMAGDGFKSFLTVGANDRLLTNGLIAGVAFDFDYEARYPQAAALAAEFPDMTPDFGEDFDWVKPFLDEGEANWAAQWGMVREPLELIAHIVMNDRSYQEVLTAPYTMVNKFTEVGYRGGDSFDFPFSDAEGFWDRSIGNVFVPAADRGQVPQDDSYEYDWENGRFESFSGYIDRPHAGILSTPAWLNRYPSTDTNRNRARARWTYYHFLGVDIEKSAPRSTDPDALADTNNPTLNNPACTVCHERMDQVAGAYQLYGDSGTYKDQWGGRDSLSELYKFPHWFGGDEADTPYREGDTWYRDMRVPGFEGVAAFAGGDSLQWLGQRIANDPRFAAATVRFWWPAVFGAEALTLPEDPNLVDYDQHLNAYNAQDALIRELADGFVASGYQLRSLLADMVLSPWYRTSLMTDDTAFSRSVELATVGSGRLLTPEELDRKNIAVFGRTWQEDRNNPHHFETVTSALRAPNGQAGYTTLYGGIDSASTITRNRSMTALMSNVAQRMSLELACQVVLEDFRKPQGDRLVFTQVEKTDEYGLAAAEEFFLAGKVEEDDWSAWIPHSRSTQASLPGGRVLLRINDMTSNSYDRYDSDLGGNADLIIRNITISRAGQVVRRIEGVDLESQPGFAADTWTDDEGRVWNRGDVRDHVPGYWLHEQAWVTFEVDLPAGDYEFTWELGTSVFNNTVTEGVLAQISMSALDRPEETEVSTKMASQIGSLLERATGRRGQASEQAEFLQMLVEHAASQAEEGSFFFTEESDCSTWMLPGWRDLSNEEWSRRAGDPNGMLRGWTLVVEAIMNSFGYLHD